jgi:DNA-binding Lrp family transcriptional regulator
MGASRLPNHGVIRRYVALLEPRTVGLDVIA